MTMFLAPYTAIADIDGSPLDAGFLFFGEYGKDPELFPVEVFWDADFTVPAAQPIRTRNGYPVRNGSPTKVYLKTAQHSIVIKNRNSAFVLVDFNNKGWDASFVVDASGMTQQAVNNIFSRKLEKVIYASDFNIKGDGTDEATKVQLMLNNIRPSTIVDFEGKTVICGQQVAINTKSNFRLENGYIKASPLSITSSENRVMFLNACSNFVLSNFDFDGNRENRTPQEKSIHTLTFRECKNFFCFNVNALNSVCDGFYFDCRTPLIKATQTQNGFFFNCKSDNAYRNSAAIIVGHDLHFNNCEFTGANGTLPMAGFDLESNGYGGDGLIENIFFNDCKFKGNVGWQLMVTQHDSPRNIFVNGGEITAPNVSDKWILNGALVPTGTVGATQLPDASNCGGCQITNPDTVFDGTVFEDFPVGSGAALRIGANAGAFASLLGCKFRNILNTGYQAITTHVLSDGIYLDNRCEFYQCSTGLSLNGKSNKLHNSVFNECGLIYSGASGGFVELSNNTMSNGTADRFIYLESTGSVIKDNRLLDLLHASPVAYIQSEAVGSVVDKNRCSATTAQTTTVGIRFNATNGKSLQDNECVNLHSTAPFSIANTCLLYTSPSPRD